MRALIEVYRGDQDERVTLEAGQLQRLDDTYSVRLVEAACLCCIGLCMQP